ncbi:MAG: TonB-dependent receptor [Alphaproteobacteria bacterium]|nr:TonB-dependent receptor [Alphaproteobacteria bacterium]
MGRIRLTLPLSARGAPLAGATARLLQVFAALVALLVASPALAQQDGTLIVDVLDDSDLEVPGARVTLSGPALIGGSQTQVTGAAGQVKFTAIPPSTDYALSAEHDTLQVSKLNNVVVKIGSPTRVTMKMSGIEEIVVTEKEKAINTESTSRGEVLTKDFLQKIPSGRSYQSATQMASGVTPDSGGNPNIGGAASNENTYMIDGANVTDPVTGTFGNNFNFDAIQQIEVLLGGYMPEYGVSIGGVVNVVTDSGSNNLQFISSVYYANSNLRPRTDERWGHDGVQLAPSGFEQTGQSFFVNALVSGPVVRDKAFFILSYVNERGLDAYAGTPQRRDYDGHYVYGKLTIQPSSEHRFTLGLQTDPASIANGTQGTPYIKAEAQDNQEQGGFVGNARWQWFLSPDASLDTVATLQRSNIRVGSVPCTHDTRQDRRQCRPGEEEGYIDWYTPGRSGIGGAYDSVNYASMYFSTRQRFQITSKLSLTNIKDPLGGTHDLKFGIGTEQTSESNLQGYNGNLLYIDVNSTSYDPTTFANYYYLETSSPIRYQVNGSIYNFFLQDSWKPVKNLTINYGTRYDNSVMRNDLGEAVLRANLWGPRLFAAWDPWGNQKTKIATGYGRFNDRGTLGIAGFTSASGFGSKLFFGEYFDNYSNGRNENYSYSPVRNLNISNDKLRNPYTDEVILTLEREVINDVAISSSMSGKFTRNLYEFDDVNLVYSENGDSIIGSRRGDVNNLYGRLRTPSLARRDVFQWDLAARKVLSHRWAARVTYTFQQALGTTNRSLTGTFAVDQQVQHNYGPLQTVRNHVFRALAIWDLPTDPWTQQIGIFFLGASGVPVDRFYYGAAQQGYSNRIQARRTYTNDPGFWDLGIRFQQYIDLRKGQLQLSVEAQNITNNRGGGYIYNAQVYQNNRFVRFIRQDPLQLMFGARYEF